ncbi:MAG: hypothetical protein E7536_03850 [Ruminococcaceae bacterium]|nr:hypothetical protein [Oscillospiraceae bacterium]
MENIKVKKKIKSWLIFLCVIILFLPIFGFSYLLFHCLFNAMVRFDIITVVVGRCLAFFISLSFSVVFVAFILKRYILKRKSNLLMWLSYGAPKYVLWYALTVISLSSLRAELIWNVTEMKDVLMLSWTIFGIAITLFLVWYLLNGGFLEKQIKRLKEQSEQKEKFSFNYAVFNLLTIYNQRTSSIFLLLINLLMLIITTSRFYIVNAGSTITLLNQNLMIICFFLCCNTVADMFIGISQVLIAENKSVTRKLDYLFQYSFKKYQDGFGKSEKSDDERNFNELAEIDKNYNRLPIVKLFQKILKSSFFFGDIDVVDNKDSINENDHQ